MKTNLFLLALHVFIFTNISAQQVSFSKSKLEPVNVSMLVDSLDGKAVVKVVKDAAIKPFHSILFIS